MSEKETMPTTIDETKSDPSELVDLNKKGSPEESIKKSPTEIKPKPSVWTEVSGQTLQQLKEQAKITYDKLGGSGGGRKEKKGSK